MKKNEKNFTGIRGYNIFYREWLPDNEENIKGFVQIAHGFAEHSARYINVVNQLVPANYAVFANDHYGHGKSDGPRGYIKNFDDYIEDQRIFKEEILKNHPILKEKPHFILGHSLGSLIAFYYSIKYPKDFDGLILSGFGTRNGSEVSSFLLFMSKILSKVFPKGTIDPELGKDFISRDKEVCKAYYNDPLVFVETITFRLAAEMIKVQDKVMESAPQIKLPLLIQTGSADTAMLGHEHFEELFTMDDKTIKEYDGLYHEVYNELEKDRKIVLNDLQAWLDNHL